MLDRILQAISPALAFELQRIVEETRQSLETEYDGRLKAAETVRQQAVDRAIEQTRASVHAQFTQKLATNDEALKKAATEWGTERERLKKEIQQLRTFVDAQNQLADARSQPEMLARWLQFAEPFARSIAVYIAKDDGLSFWKSRGDAVFPEIISEQITDPESFFRPIIVRDKTVAAVSALPPYQVEPLNFLASTMERAILIFGMKLKSPPRTDSPEMARSTQKF